MSVDPFDEDLRLTMAPDDHEEDLADAEYERIQEEDAEEHARARAVFDELSPDQVKHRVNAAQEVAEWSRHEGGTVEDCPVCDSSMTIANGVCGVCTYVLSPEVSYWRQVDQEMARQMSRND